MLEQCASPPSPPGPSPPASPPAAAATTTARAARPPRRRPRPRSRHPQRRGLDLRRADLPAGRRDLKGQGLTLNYQGVGSGAGVSQFTAGTVDFAGSDPALKPTRRPAAIKKGTPVQVPFALGAITASYNLERRRSGLKLDGKTLADIYLGKVKKWNDPAIKALNPDVKLPATEDHRRPPLGLLGHDQGLHPVPGQLLARVEERARASTRTSSGRPAPAPRATTASPPRSSRPTARSATSSRPTRCRTTSRSPTSRTSRASTSRPTLESTSAAGEGIDDPGGPAASRRSTRRTRRRTRSSRRRSRSPTRTRARPGLDEDKAKGLKAFLDYLLGDGQATIKKLSYAPLPDEPQDQGPGRGRRACSATAPRSRS